ncbi:MAG: BON domain-containing protein [Polyangiaceae bacterium]
MKRSFILISTALLSVACGGSNTPSATDPSTATTTAAPVDSTTTAVDPNASSTPTDSTQSPTAATSVTPTPGSNPAMANANTTTPPAPATNAGAPVTENPGAANGTSSADNTGTNKRDRHGALTPIDQGNSKSELNITASIRKGVVGDSSLSFTAKNVKIITVGTKVTLRGPVKTDAERAAIEARARQTAGVTEVDNQIEVKK